MTKWVTLAALVATGLALLFPPRQAVGDEEGGWSFAPIADGRPIDRRTLAFELGALGLLAAGALAWAAQADAQKDAEGARSRRWAPRGAAPFRPAGGVAPGDPVVGTPPVPFPPRPARASRPAPARTTAFRPVRTAGAPTAPPVSAPTPLPEPALPSPPAPAAMPPRVAGPPSAPAVDPGPALGVVFARHFARWALAVPADDLRHRRAGFVQGQGWHVQYVFGRDATGEHLDYYATHPAVDDRHVRLRPDGEAEALPALATRRATALDPAEDARLERAFYAQNRAVAEGLDAKGFRFTREMAARVIPEGPTAAG